MGIASLDAGSSSIAAKNSAACARRAASLAGSIRASVRAGIAMRGLAASSVAWRAMKSQ